MEYTHIKTKKALRSYVKTFEDTKNAVIALDIEAELNRHVYGETLCLVQIYDGEDTVLIDPLDTGAEPIAGSTRMKAGTAQRITLNVFSSVVMKLPFSYNLSFLPAQ